MRAPELDFPADDAGAAAPRRGATRRRRLRRERGPSVQLPRGGADHPRAREAHARGGRRGREPGSGSRFPSGVDWMVGWIAAARIGAVAMLFSSTYQPPELRNAMRIGDVSLLLAPRHVARERLRGASRAGGSRARRAAGPGPLYVPELPYLRAIWVVGGSERPWVTPVAFDAVDDTGISDELLAAVESEVSPADPAVVVYTSGSAAEPKAVVHTHGTVVRKTSTGSTSVSRAPTRVTACCARCRSSGSAACRCSRARCTAVRRSCARSASTPPARSTSSSASSVTTMLGWATTLTEINEGSRRRHARSELARQRPAPGVDGREPADRVVEGRSAEPGHDRDAGPALPARPLRLQGRRPGHRRDARRGRGRRVLRPRVRAHGRLLQA